jgi:hypothetical protein
MIEKCKIAETIRMPEIALPRRFALQDNTLDLHNSISMSEICLINYIYIYFTDINNVIYNEFKIRVFPKNIFDRCWIARSNFRCHVKSSQLSFWGVFLQNSAVWRCCGCGCCWVHAAQNYRQDGQNNQNQSKNSQKEPKNNVVRSKWGWKGRNAPKIILKKTGKY